MTPTEYIAASVRTGITDYKHLHTTTVSENILHAAIGMCTEAGELLDACKKSVIYGKTFDEVNGDEEVGDLLWYVALYCFQRNLTFEQLFEQNIAKLQARYPDKFTEEAALNRDIPAEREILEARSKPVPADKVPLDDQTALTRNFIKLHGEQPIKNDALYVVGLDRTYDYNGLLWELRSNG